MSTISTRPAIEEDADHAIDVLRRSITELCVLDHQNDMPTLERWLSNKTRGNFVRWLGDPESHLVVATSATAIVGVAALHRSAEVRLCYVHPNFTHRGVGSSLLSAVEAQARRCGVEELTLTSSLTARAFYERCGYAPAGPSTNAFGVLQAYPYSKLLAP
jgi:N-acetylglutamate synthase-like GNAT family acetyltransferase